MNKLLISLLSLTGVAGISAGSYFLLRDNSESSNGNSDRSNIIQGKIGENGQPGEDTPAAKAARESVGRKAPPPSIPYNPPSRSTEPK